MSRDATVILWAQAVRAFAYGLGAVLLGTTLDERGLSSVEVGIVLAAVVAGTVLASVAVGRWGDRFGRRRFYAWLYVALAMVGVVFASVSATWLLVLAALTGALSTEVVESGPFTSLEQAMLASELTGRTRVRGFGVYNAVATAAGSLGALAATAPELLRHVWSGAPSDERWFWLFVPAAAAGVVLASRLSSTVEAPLTTSDATAAPTRTQASAGLGRSRPTVARLAVLFATDSFGGGFVIQSFIAFWLTRRFGATTATIGLVFFAFGVLQTASFLAAPRLAERFGLLSTMVFTHLPSNLLLVAVAFAPNLGIAVALLLARVALSQMDVPTRQAYVMALVAPHERTAAAAYTNTARYLARPAGPALAGATASM
ncbi:MAG TPA: MFS transporter [Mycobacteriales bacterium]|nr:MFS transporter [Mycobacteriales bacterium]